MMTPVRIFLSLLFPPRCASCRELLTYDSDELFCGSCAEKWENEISAECPKCGRRFSRCTCDLDGLGDNIDALFSVSAYTSGDSVTDRMVLAAKDRNERDLLNFMADKMTDSVRGEPEISRDLLVTFVPRSALRKSETGHDQSEILARLIAKRLGVNSERIFKKKGSKQQKRLGKSDRLTNAKSSYVMLNGVCEKVRGRDILLCDDVVTTGASLSVCAEQLKKAGARTVYAVSFAKTVKGSKKSKNKK